MSTALTGYPAFLKQLYTEESVRQGFSASFDAAMARRKTPAECLADDQAAMRQLVAEATGAPCRWCGHPFVPEGRRRVCTNCGGPRVRE